MDPMKGSKGETIAAVRTSHRFLLTCGHILFWVPMIPLAITSVMGVVGLLGGSVFNKPGAWAAIGGVWLTSALLMLIGSSLLRRADPAGGRTPLRGSGGDPLHR